MNSKTGRKQRRFLGMEDVICVGREAGKDGAWRKGRVVARNE